MLSGIEDKKSFIFPKHFNTASDVDIDEYKAETISVSSISNSTVFSHRCHITYHSSPATRRRAFSV